MAARRRRPLPPLARLRPPLPPPPPPPPPIVTATTTRRGGITADLRTAADGLPTQTCPPGARAGGAPSPPASTKKIKRSGSSESWRLPLLVHVNSRFLPVTTARFLAPFRAHGLLVPPARGPAAAVLASRAGHCGGRGEEGEGMPGRSHTSPRRGGAGEGRAERALRCAQAERRAGAAHPARELHPEVLEGAELRGRDVQGGGGCLR